MLPAKTLMQLAYKALKSGSREDASALASLALEAPDAHQCFADGDPTFDDEVPSPVPSVEDEQTKSVVEEDESATLTSLLKHGESGNMAGPGAPLDQKGYHVEGTYRRVQAAADKLELIGLRDLSLEIRNCLR